MPVREIVVIGAGPAGCAAAIEAARAGAGVTLVAEEPIGGRATHASLVPSKVLLHAVHDRRAKERGIAPIALEMAQVVARAAEIASRRLEDAGVRVVRGVATLVSEHEVDIAREGKDALRERFDAAIVAVGSVPVFPERFFGEAKGPDGEKVLAPRHLRTMRDLPGTLMVVGGGATGAEIVHAMVALGVEVTWVLDELGILPDFDRELADSIGDVLMERGVKIVHGKRVTSVTRGGDGVLAALDGGRTYSAERAMIAIGRRADTARLGLGSVGIEVERATGAIPVDASLRSRVPTILACGDAAGRPFVASKAGVEGWIAARSATGRAVPEGARTWVETVFTDPEIAIVGVTPQKARAARRAIEVRTVGFDESVRGILADVGIDPHARGVLRVVIDEESRAVIGATAIGPRASEVLGPLAVAIAAKTTVDALAAAGLASPTFGELAAAAARS